MSYGEALPTESWGWYDENRQPGSGHSGINTVVNLSDNLKIGRENSETVKSRFERLRDTWLLAISDVSSLDDIVDDASYQEIISMRDSVVEHILEDLMKSPKPWFYALYEITGKTQIPESSAGNMRKMTDAWIEWGKKAGYV